MADAPASGGDRPGGAPERGHRQRGRDTDLRVAAEHGYTPGRGGRGHALDDPLEMGAGRRGDGVQQPHGVGAHGREIAEVDQDRTPPRPLGVTLDHRGEDGVARRDEIGARHRRPVVTAEPGRTEATGLPGERGQESRQQGLGGVGETLDPVDRPPHPAVGATGDDRPRPGVDPPQGGEQRRVAVLDSGVEPQHTSGLHVRAGGADQGWADAAGMGSVGHDESAAGPPPDVRLRARSDPDAAEDRAVGGDGDEHQSAGIGVHLVEVAHGEEPLAEYELLVPEPVVGGDGTWILGDPHHRARLRAAASREEGRGGRAQDGLRRAGPARKGGAGEVSDFEHRLSPRPTAARCTPRTPRSRRAGRPRPSRCAPGARPPRG